MVPFEGRQPASSHMAKVRALLLLHYAGLKERIDVGIPEREQAMRDAGVDYVIYLYEGANHACLNDTSEAPDDPQAARLAWSRTIDFFKWPLADPWIQI